MTTNLVVYQGPIEALGTSVESIASKFKGASVVVLSHVAYINDNLPNPTMCEDVRYPEISKLVGLIKSETGAKVFGYVPSTADAPYSSDCGNNLKGPWTPPNGICSNFIQWVDFWLMGTMVDGIMIDLVGPEWITPSTRDDVFSYVKSFGVSIMANCPEVGLNVQFACESSYFGKGDYVLVEGFCYANGQYRLPDGIDCQLVLKPYRAKGINLAALTTEAWATEQGQEISYSWPNYQYALEVFKDYYHPGDVMQYTTADLGTVSETFQFPPSPL